MTWIYAGNPVLFPKVNEDRHYMKRKEANAFEEQLLKQKMDELHKKLHQVVETSQENLPVFQERSEVRMCFLLSASRAQWRWFLFVLAPFWAMSLDLILILM